MFMTKTRIMGSLSKRESQVLKLVHPGGFAELHTKPVMASEVMSKNPRHYVTRPDIFRFPWIVVSPESILRPGSVFFIVPCHTIRCLLKNPTTTTAANHTSLKQHHRHESHVDQGCYRARKNDKISNSKKKIQRFRVRDQSSSVSSTPSTMSCMKLRTTPPREAQKQKTKKKNAGNKEQSFVGSERTVYSYSSEYYSSRDHAAKKERAISKSRGSSLGHCDQKGSNNLKPCLKKDNTMMMSHSARSRNLKVRFACTDDEDLNNTLTQLKKRGARDSRSIYRYGLRAESSLEHI